MAAILYICYMFWHGYSGTRNSGVMSIWNFCNLIFFSIRLHAGLWILGSILSVGIIDPMYFPDMSDNISPSTGFERAQIAQPHVYTSTVVERMNVWRMFLLDIPLD